MEERGKDKDKHRYERITSIDCLLHELRTGPGPRRNLQPRYLSLTEIEPKIAGHHSICWIKPTRGRVLHFVEEGNYFNGNPQYSAHCFRLWDEEWGDKNTHYSRCLLLRISLSGLSWMPAHTMLPGLNNPLSSNNVWPTATIFNECVEKIFETSNTWQNLCQGQRHLFPYIVKLKKNGNNKHKNIHAV